MKEEIVCFDVETTGFNKQGNYIIQLAAVRFNSQTFEVVKKKNWYIMPKDPNFTIDPHAFEKHGLTKEFIVEHGVTLDSIFPELVELFSGADVLTYNGNTFDNSFLYRNLKEYGLELDYTNIRFYDAFRVEINRNPNTLESVYQRYTQEELVGAHDAYNDVNATIEVFRHQIMGGLDDIDTEEFDMISPEGFLKRNREGVAVFANGKYLNEAVVDICKKDPSYIRWLFDNCSNITKQTVMKEYYKDKNSN